MFLKQNDLEGSRDTENWSNGCWKFNPQEILKKHH